MPELAWIDADEVPDAWRAAPVPDDAEEVGATEMLAPFAAPLPDASSAWAFASDAVETVASRDAPVPEPTDG